MTPEELSQFCDDLDVLYQKHKDHLPGDGGLENVLNGIAEVLRHDGGQQTHEQVRGCLDGAAEMCEMAAMNYYASFK